MTDRTTETLRDAADALEALAVAQHHATHGTRTRWGACAKDSCPRNRQLADRLRFLATIRTDPSDATDG